VQFCTFASERADVKPKGTHDVIGVIGLRPIHHARKLVKRSRRAEKALRTLGVGVRQDDRALRTLPIASRAAGLLIETLD
jgi:hypothetical protein